VKQQPAETVQHLRAAERAFDRTRMQHCLAVTRLRLAQADPADARARDQAAAWTSAEGIVDPGRLADTFAPGAWTTLS
jgi:hypothetical protein